MKSYEEALNDIYVKAYKKQRQINRRRKMLARIALVCIALGMALFVGMGRTANEKPPAIGNTLPNNDPSAPVDTYHMGELKQDVQGMTLAQMTEIYTDSVTAWMNENLGAENWRQIDYEAQAEENWTKVFYVISFVDLNGNGIFDGEESVARYHWYYQTDTGAWADEKDPDGETLLYDDTVDTGPLAHWLQTASLDVAYSYGCFQLSETGTGVLK